VTPAATWQVLLGESCEINAVELHDTIAEVLEDTTHDTVLARVDLDTNLVLVLFVGISNGISMDGTIVKFDACCNASEIGLGHILVKPYVIDLLLDVLGMGEFRSEVTIVGEEQHTSGVAVETTNRIDTLAACIAHQIHNGLTALWIIAGGDGILRLVEEYIDLALEAYGLVVEGHLILAGHLGAEFGYDLTVYLDQTSCDVLVGFTTRANACIGQILVETQFLIRIDDCLGVFHRTMWVVALMLAIGFLLLRTSETSLLGTTVATLRGTTITSLLGTAITALLGTTVATLLGTAITTLLTTVTALWTAVTTLLRTLIAAWLVTALWLIVLHIAAFLWLLILLSLAFLWLALGLLIALIIIVALVAVIGTLWTLVALIAALLAILVVTTITALGTLGTLIATLVAAALWTLVATTLLIAAFAFLWALIAFAILHWTLVTATTLIATTTLVAATTLITAATTISAIVVGATALIRVT